MSPAARAAGELLGPNERLAWRIAQSLVWLVGVAILMLLAFAPRLGLHATWNMLIPVAPALLVLAPGVWRNICPLGSTSQLPQHLGLSAGRKLTPSAQTALQVGGLALLLLIVPLRHASLNLDAEATLAALLVLGVLALGAGIAFGGKSGWCAGLCPVHPVEKLYGQEAAVNVANAHCGRCQRCVDHCPDSSPGMHPLASKSCNWRTSAGRLLVGGFPGYIWGWFRVADAAPGSGWSELGGAFAFPFGAMAVSLGVYVLIGSLLPEARRRLLDRSFAALAVTLYYWHRLPSLIGHGLFPGDGMLLDLTGVVSPLAILPLQIAAAAFFAWWLVLRRGRAPAWQVRPRFADAARSAERENAS